MKNRNKLLILVSSLIVLVISVLVLNDSNDREEVDVSKGIVSHQQLIEDNLSTSGYTSSEPNIILDPYGISPLTALILFETEEEVSPKIVVEGLGEDRNIEGMSKSAKKHFIPIYGLYPDKDNNVTIDIGGEKVNVVITTDPLPEDFPLPTDIVASEDVTRSDELYFFTPSSDGYTSAYDSSGNVRWYLTEKMVWDISRLSNGNLALSTERSINPPYFTTGLYEIDLLGKIYNEYSLPGGYHHDFFEMNDGNLLVASNEFNNDQGTVEDVIVEVDRKSGDIVKSWDLKESIGMEEGKSENWSEYDWFHNNSVWYDEEEDVIILSGRHQDAVVAIDYYTGGLKWVIGDPTGWSDEYQEYFFKPIGDDFEWQWSQHAAMVTPEGYIFILDNGNNKSKIEGEYVPAEDSYTRGVMYDIDTKEMTIKQVWEYGKDRGHEFYSPYISDVDYLGENHYMVHSGGIVYLDGEISNRPAGFDKDPELYSTTVELKDDEVIFEMTLPTNMYRTEKMSLYNNTEFELISAERLGSLGKSKVDNEFEGLPINLSEVDSLYESKDISIVKEEDRLVFNGTFNKTEKVRVILSDNNSSREYNIRVSKKPYTAMCLDIFSTFEDEDEIEVYKYINSEGLSGVHSIFVSIGEDVYDTKLNVTF